MTTNVAVPIMTGEEMIAVSKKHTLYEWSVQSQVDPLPVAKAKGIYFWTPEGKRFIDFNSQHSPTPIRSWPPNAAHASARSSPKLLPATSIPSFSPMADPRKDGPVTYVQSGKTYRVEAAACILACWNMMIPALVPELPATQKEALSKRPPPVAPPAM